MNFDLSEEQRLLQSTLDGFLENEFPLRSVREFFESDEDQSPGLWKGLADLGVMGLHLPEDHGGAGLELLDLLCVAECFGYHAVPGPFLGHVIAGLSIRLAGSPAQKREWLPRLASGERIGSIAFAEPNGCWQPDEWTLAPSGDDRLSGIRPHVLSGRVADIVVVGLADGQLGLIETEHEGVGRESLHDLDRTRRQTSLHLDRVPFERLPMGGSVSGRIRDAALVLLAGDAVGGARRCVELAVAYANQREQFGRTIGHFQALKHQLADLALASEPCRALSWFAAHAWDHLPRDAPRAAAHAKSHVTDAFLSIARDTIEVHGGIGYTWECEIHYWLKRAVLDRAYLGPPRVHRLRAADLAGW